jgi:AraC-like DNA-binding protein
LSRLQDLPFSMNFACAQFGAAIVGRGAGTMNGVARTRAAIGIDGSDNFSLGINMSAATLIVGQGDRELALGPGESALFAHFEEWKWRSNAAATFLTLNVSRHDISERLVNVEDLLLKPLDSKNAALRHLWQYAEFLMRPDIDGNNPMIEEQVGTTLIDLLGLSLGASRDATELARMRGLRMVRLWEALTGIKSSFSDPSFSTESLARRMGLSRRYVNDLLYESGTTFADRVMELRLQKARALLCDRRNDRLKVSEIAYACGFNELSYFNRCFKRRFGGSPTQYRGAGGTTRGTV